MIVIRKEQMEEFEKMAMPRFESFVLEHLQEHFPKPCELAGKEQILKLIRMGIAQATELGLKTRHEICLYIDLMMILGCGFATDPQYPWAQELLDKKRHRISATRRINSAYARAMQYLDATVGKNNVFPVMVYRSLRHYSMAALREHFGNDLLCDSMRLYAEVWPQKHSLVGETALGRLVTQCFKSAKRHGLISVPDVGVFALFAYILGHGFDADPMYPWVSAQLSEDSDSSPVQKLARLHAEAMKVLDEVAS